MTREARAGFLRAQRLAYDAVETVAKQLRVGMTEREAAQLLADHLKANGTERYLHRPFACSASTPGSTATAAMATTTRAIGGWAPTKSPSWMFRRLSMATSAMSGTPFRSNPTRCSEPAKAFQLELRADIPGMFASAMTPAQIWAEVDRRVTDAGFDNVHAKYPHCVLGHRVFKVKPKAGRHLRLGWGGFGWFSLETNVELFRMGPSQRWAPITSATSWACGPSSLTSAGRPAAASSRNWVVEQGGAHWLDDDVPHVREAAGKAPARP